MCVCVCVCVCVCIYSIIICHNKERTAPVKPKVLLHVK